MIQNSIVYKEDIFSILCSDLDWSKLNNKSILITGASGMNGSFLVDLLMQRNKEYRSNICIYALGRNKERAKMRFSPYFQDDKFKFIEHDINDELQEIGNINYIIHAASNTHPVAYSTDPVGTITTNILGTYNLLNYASKHKVERFIFLSSVEIYGENRGDVEKFDETYCGYIDSNTLRAGYPESKRAGEALCNAFIKKYNIDVVIPRLSRVYGPTSLSSDSKALSQFINNAVNDEDIVLKSKGNQHYSYCYVADVVGAILTILIKGKSGEAYNVSDDYSNITLRQLAEILSSVNNRKVIYRLPDEEELVGFSKVTKAILDNSKLSKLGWKAKYDINKGLSQTVKVKRELRGVKK